MPDNIKPMSENFLNQQVAVKKLWFFGVRIEA